MNDFAGPLKNNCPNYLELFVLVLASRSPTHYTICNYYILVFYLL
jgi:hypothetical protein